MLSVLPDQYNLPGGWKMKRRLDAIGTKRLNLKRREVDALESIADSLMKIKWLVSEDINLGEEE